MSKKQSEKQVVRETVLQEIALQEIALQEIALREVIAQEEAARESSARMGEILSIRIDRSNPNHHLWNNNGTWWCHYTVHTPRWQKERVRVSLRTHSLEEARGRRDRLIAGMRAGAEA